jgi:hypothetical protein
MKPTYFLSYQAGDARLARAMHAAMTRRGISVFDPQSIAPGENFVSTIKKHVDQASGMLVLMSPNALSSWQLYEVGMADALDKPVLVVGTEASSSEQVPAELRDKRLIILQRNDQDAIEEAVDQIAGFAAIH